MKRIIQKSILVILILISTSCSKDYETVSITKFETALKEKKVDRIIYNHENQLVLVEFKDTEELFEVKNNAVLPKHWVQHIKGLVGNYNKDGIIFEIRQSVF